MTTTNNKIKVLHVIKTLNLGGAEANLFNLIQAYDSERFEHYVAYSVGGSFEPAFREKGIRLFKYAENDHKVKSFATIGIVLRLASFIRQNGIQIVHTHNYSAHVWGSLAGRLARAKVVEHVHDSRYEYPDYLRARGIPRPEQFAQSKYFAGLSNLIVVLTKRNREYLIKHGIAPENKVKICLNGIYLNPDLTADKAALRAKLGLPAEGKIVLYAGRLSPEKNPGFVLDIAEAFKSTPAGDNLQKIPAAIARKRSHGQNCTFVIAGSGPLEAVLKDDAEHRELSHKVKFIGFYPNVLDLLTITDVYIQPSLLELHSIMIIEAMSMQVPVVVSKNVGSNDDFITHGTNGFLLNPYDAPLWAETIQSLLEDPERARGIGQAGRELVERSCDIRQTARTFESIYNQLAGK